jgi:hypothetical protein
MASFDVSDPPFSALYPEVEPPLSMKLNNLYYLNPSRLNPTRLTRLTHLPCYP